MVKGRVALKQHKKAKFYSHPIGSFYQHLLTQDPQWIDTVQKLKYMHEL